MKKWTITSPTGQILNAEQEDNNVIMSSIKGNHGSVTVEAWETKVKTMQAAGYTVIIKEVK